MGLTNFPAGAGVIPVVVPLDNTRQEHITLPQGKVMGIHYTTLATTGSPTTVTATLTDLQSTPLSIATTVTQTAAAVTDATLPAAGMSLNAAEKQTLKIAVTFSGGTSPTWKGSVTILLAVGAQSQ